MNGIASHRRRSCPVPASIAVGELTGRILADCRPETKATPNAASHRRGLRRWRSVGAAASVDPHEEGAVTPDVHVLGHARLRFTVTDLCGVGCDADPGDGPPGEPGLLRRRAYGREHQARTCSRPAAGSASRTREPAWAPRAPRGVRVGSADRTSDAGRPSPPTRRFGRPMVVGERGISEVRERGPGRFTQSAVSLRRLRGDVPDQPRHGPCGRGTRGPTPPRSSDLTSPRGPGSHDDHVFAAPEILMECARRARP